MSVNPFGWSTTAASNTSVGGVSVAEGCAAANLNNGIRATMAGFKEFLDAVSGAKTSGGTADAQTLTTGLSFAAYAAGQLIGFKAGAALTNTGAAFTMAWDGLTAKTVKLVDGTAPAAGAVTAGGIYLTAYESSADIIILLNPGVGSTGVTATSAYGTDNTIVRADGTGRATQTSTWVIDDSGVVYPTVSDAGTLGSTSKMISDLFLASGAVINFNNSNYTITHIAGVLTLSGAFSLGTSNPLTVGTVELGHASDTTLARSAAGVATIEGNVIQTAGRQTLFVPASSFTARTTNGPSSGSVEMTTNKNMFITKDYDTTTQEFCQFEVWFPKSWNLSTVTFQPVWSHAATSTNFGVVFSLAGVARSDNDAGDVAFGTVQTSTDTGGTTNNIYLAPESSAITIAGTPAAGDSVQFQIARVPADGSDTLAVDARLHGIRLFYTTNATNDT